LTTALSILLALATMWSLMESILKLGGPSNDMGNQSFTEK